ncbi:hypothetical protein HZC32_03075 [Candidatus Woesearchaeota archaeon]|nr:hypothetical protein [Candidatus Woesearchaeota archaeon]
MLFINKSAKNFPKRLIKTFKYNKDFIAQMEELVQTLIEEYQGAEEEFKKGRYKNAAILFSKAFFALCDLLIYQKMNKLPKNHTERFRILEEYFPDVYKIADQIFTHYTDAYSKPILKETGEQIKDGLKKIIGTQPVPEKIREIIR